MEPFTQKAHFAFWVKGEVFEGLGAEASQRKAQGARLSAKTGGRPARSGQVLDRESRSEAVEPMAPEARQRKVDAPTE
ncbi:hypothetical protein BKP35_14970 [Anaerobacillus arseniciselenatis]|uniref:Uncharacterized protein n=1 Tax=Anaerobacillus arseniciselenatis TaxID=85682 RepID=A0A1S2LBQ2_9BACI|nr:hypothetical protein BKP35_14970 [Anaerobacillus arseniciselenatis]